LPESAKDFSGFRYIDSKGIFELPFAVSFCAEIEFPPAVSANHYYPVVHSVNQINISVRRYGDIAWLIGFRINVEEELRVDTFQGGRADWNALNEKDDY
jgi:hypothetical protein